MRSRNQGKNDFISFKCLLDLDHGMKSTPMASLKKQQMQIAKNWIAFRMGPSRARMDPIGACGLIWASRRKHLQQLIDVKCAFSHRKLRFVRK